VTERYEQPFFGPVVVNKTVITVRWKYKGTGNKYDLLMIYQLR